MLTRHCEKVIGGLIEKGDFNIRVTVGKKASVLAERSFVDESWKEIIRKAIGVGITQNTTNTYLVYCNTEHSGLRVVTAGNQIIDECWNYIKNVNIFRINIIKCPANSHKVHSWIIMRE